MGDACCAPVSSGAGESSAPRHTAFWQISQVHVATASGALLVAGLLTNGTMATALFILGLLVGGWTFIPESLRSLTHGRLGVGTLMTIAALGAVALGEYGEAASLAFLFSISEALEGWALARTRRGLRALLSLVPDRVTVARRRDHRIDRSGPPHRWRPDDRRTWRSCRHRRRRADRTVGGGSGRDHRRVGTGGDRARRLRRSSAVNGAGALRSRSRPEPRTTSLARVVHIVEEAQDRKGAGQRLADRVARPLVPGDHGPGGAIAGWACCSATRWCGSNAHWSCSWPPPRVRCAISVPVTVVAAVGAASRQGALVKGGAALEELGRIGTVALDKTGTLTRNAPRVVEVLPAGDITRDQVLTTAAALEARSEHPLARAILLAAQNAPVAEDVTAVPGHGLTGSRQRRPRAAGQAELGRSRLVARRGRTPATGRRHRRAPRTGRHPARCRRGPRRAARRGPRGDQPACTA